MARGESYEEFTEKFKPKKTTDDCLTPTGVWAAVASWVASEYGRDPGTFVRPFWPGGDYEAYDYPPGCTVVDNPPFSILSAILRFYVERRLDFFLFAPTLTLFTGWSPGLCYVPVGNQITYANGAKVNTSYITSLEPGTRLRTAPRLYQAVKRANEESVKATTKTLPKYVFPDAVISAAQIYKYSRLGIDFRVAARDCCYISWLDAMKERNKDSGIFGGALLLSPRAAAERAAAERAAAERAAAERAAATVWPLSAREIAMSVALGRRDRMWFFFDV